MTIDYSISTITMSLYSSNNISLNLINIGKYLIIDNEKLDGEKSDQKVLRLIGMKYNLCKTTIFKGIYETNNYKQCKNKNRKMINKKTFYNQITFIIRIFNPNETESYSDCNVKLFENGSFHLTGVKDINDGKLIFDKIYEKITEISTKNHNILLCKDSNGIYLDNENFIYGSTNNNIIGFKYTKDNNIFYNINNKDYTFTQFTYSPLQIPGYGLVYNNIESKRTRHILDLDGNNIGHCQIVLFKNRNKLYKNSKIIYQNDLIYSKNILLGKIDYFIDKTITLDNPDNNVKEILYNPKYYKTAECGNPDYNYDVNCINIVFSINSKINRNNFFLKLLDKGYICKYNPNQYSAILLTFKMNELNNTYNGLCYCDKKCSCSNITFMIFQTGKILAVGFKNTDIIGEILNEFRKLI